MKKVLITGNSGYIGSHLSKMLAADYELYGIDINTPQSPVVEHYLNDIRALTGKTIVKFDTIIHLAAVVRINQSELNPKEYYTTNLNGTLNILENISYKNFIFASTGAAEACFSPYGVSKRAAEDCIREYCVKNKINYTMFRFYNVFGTDGFGPTNPDGLMFNLLKSKETGIFTIFGNDYDTPDGTCVRDYVHVNEICDAIKTAIENPSNSIECLGHGVGHSVLEMARLFEQINDVTIDITFANRRDGDLPVSVLKNVSPYMKNLYSIQQLLKV